MKKLNDFPFRNRVARKIRVVTIIRCGVEGRHVIAPVRVVLYCTHVQDRNTRKEDRWLEFCGGGRGGIPPFPLKRSPAHRWPPILLFIPSPFFLHGGFSLECLKANYRAYSSIETVFTYCVIRNPLRLYWKSRLV